MMEFGDLVKRSVSKTEAPRYPAVRGRARIVTALHGVPYQPMHPEIETAYEAVSQVLAQRPAGNQSKRSVLPRSVRSGCRR